MLSIWWFILSLCLSLTLLPPVHFYFPCACWFIFPATLSVSHHSSLVHLLPFDFVCWLQVPTSAFSIVFFYLSSPAHSHLSSSSSMTPHPPPSHWPHANVFVDSTHWLKEPIRECTDWEWLHRIQDIQDSASAAVTICQQCACFCCRVLTVYVPMCFYIPVTYVSVCETQCACNR